MRKQTPFLSKRAVRWKLSAEATGFLKLSVDRKAPHHAPMRFSYESYADLGPCLSRKSRSASPAPGIYSAYPCDFSPSIARLARGPMASSWLCTTTHRPAISRQTLVFLIRVNSVPTAVAKVTSK